MKLCDHTSVGIMVQKNGRLLLIERKRPPHGFAPPSGHVDDHGTYEKAAIDETREEVGLNISSLTLVYEGDKNNPCRRQMGTWHHWKVYVAIASGIVRPSPDETKGFIWANQDKISSLIDRTRNYQMGYISEEEWQKSPGIEPIWVELLEDILQNNRTIDNSFAVNDE